jgi:hypothetical protein
MDSKLRTIVLALYNSQADFKRIEIGHTGFEPTFIGLVGPWYSVLTYAPSYNLSITQGVLRGARKEKAQLKTLSLFFPRSFVFLRQFLRLSYVYYMGFITSLVKFSIR